MTARDLAKLIGVSQSAISRAFTPGASISGELRERILSSARMLGYRPNAIASILSRRKSDIVALVISDLRNPYYPPLLEKLSRGLQQLGQQSLLFNITPGVDVKQQLMALRQYNVDALVIVSATILSGEELNLAAEGRRAVLVNRIAPDTTLTSVICDNAGRRPRHRRPFLRARPSPRCIRGGPAEYNGQSRAPAFLHRTPRRARHDAERLHGWRRLQLRGWLPVSPRNRPPRFDRRHLLRQRHPRHRRNSTHCARKRDCAFPTISPSLASTTSRWRLGRAMGSRLTASRSTPSSRRHCSSSLHQRRRSQTHRGGIICSRENWRSGNPLRPGRAESIIPPSGDRLVEKDDAETRS